VQKTKKAFMVDNRLNHCAIGTLDSVMFAMLHLKTVIHRNRLAYYIVGYGFIEIKSKILKGLIFFYDYSSVPGYYPLE
jgi:hypothetical protein